MFQVRIEKLQFIVEEMQVAFHMATKLTADGLRVRLDGDRCDTGARRSGLAHRRTVKAPPKPDIHTGTVRLHVFASGR